MYYHVLIETKEKDAKTGKNRQIFELDKMELLEVEKDIIVPYLNKEHFQFDGYFLDPSDIVRVVVKQSEKTTEEYAKNKREENIRRGIFFLTTRQGMLGYDNYMEDITKEVFKKVQEKIPKNPNTKNKEIITKIDMKKVFIVHGQDEAAKQDVARFLEKLGLEAIILHEQPNKGKTIIEKIEHYSNVGFGIVLYTPCDVGAKKGEENNLQSRARQNVVFEHGYLIGKLGREKVCALLKDNLEKPNDISGVVYIEMDKKRGWMLDLCKELKNAGYSVDMNLL